MTTGENNKQFTADFKKKITKKILSAIYSIEHIDFINSYPEIGNANLNGALWTFRFKKARTLWNFYCSIHFRMCVNQHICFQLSFFTNEGSLNNEKI